MPIQIKAPDGSTVQFPDGTPDAVITGVMQKEYGGPAGARMISAPGAGPVSVQAKFPQGKPKSSLLDQIGAFAQAATEQVPFLDEAAAGTAALIYQRPYAEMRKRLGTMAAEDRKERPLARNAGGVAGFGATLVAPGGAYIAGAKNGAQSAIRAAQVGAAYGALGGAGAADGGLMNRAKGAAIGGATGATLAPALGAAIRVAPKLARRAGAGTSEAASRVAGMVGREPAQAAVTARDTARAQEIIRDMAARKGITPETARADPALMAGKPITGAELIGREAQTNLMALGRRGGTTPDLLEEVIQGRAEGAPQRIVEDFQAVSGVDPSAVADDFGQMTAALRKVAGPAYDAAYGAGGVDSETLRALSQRPAVQSAMRRAMSIAAEEGRNPTEIGFRVAQRQGPAGEAFVTRQERVPGGGTREVRERVATAGPMEDHLVEVQNPTAQTWDYVKRGMDDVLEGYRDPVTRRLNLDERGRAIVGTHGKLRDELVAQNPAYGEALSKGGEPLRLEQAWRDAPGLLSNNVSERVFRKRLDSLGEAERAAFTGGFANALFEKARAGRLRVREFSTPAFKAKLQALLGDEDAGRMTTLLEQETRLARGNRMAPNTNSPTAEVRQAIREQDNGRGLLGEFNRRLERGEGLVSAVTATGAEAAASPVVGFLRGVQAPYGPGVRDELGRILLSPEETIAALLKPARKPPARAGLLGRGAVGGGLLGGQLPQ